MKKSIIYLLHASLWAYVLLNSSFRNVLMPRITYEFNQEMFFIMALSYPLCFYLSYFFALRLLRNKKARLYGLAAAICLVLLIPLLFGGNLAIYSPLLLLSILPPLFTGALFRFFIDWLQKDKQQLQLSKQNLQSELALLRNQLNPHFLFNSLHNIDTLISTNPGKASDSLLKLSDMMRYMLYEANTEKVEIRQEAEYLEKYVDLQRLRLKNEEAVSLQIEIHNGDIPIAPMLFIPFVENAFKHSTDKSVKNSISISIKTNKEGVLFEIINIFDKKRQLTKDATSGIGLNNVKRRLALLYPQHHHLEITQENDLYHVKLTINTNAG